MKKVTAPYLLVIRESIAAIESYRPADRETFLRSSVLRDAVLMRLQVIGENLVQVRRIDEDVFQQQAADSWHKLIGLRNIISHGYTTIEFERIWQIITEELPAFAASIDTAADDANDIE